MDDKDFYIGWQPVAPGLLAKHIYKVVAILAVLLISMALILSLGQKKFAAGKFEYGRLTEVKGMYRQFPVPSLKVMTREDPFGNRSFITIPLVGYGKAGADGVIKNLEQEQKTVFDHKEVTFRGTLIYNNGKTLLQIDQNDDPLVSLAEQPLKDENMQPKELGRVTLEGEILDPKCYFGVMKPGQGKPHRDCAIRCIAGGINPVFYTLNEKGEAGYYLVLDENGNRINNWLKDYVAEPVSLEARAVQFEDWIILYVSKTSLKRTGKLSWFKKDAISCKPGY